jgi:type II secretory pathway component PulK
MTRSDFTQLVPYITGLFPTFKIESQGAERAWLDVLTLDKVSLKEAEKAAISARRSHDWVNPQIIVNEVRIARRRLEQSQPKPTVAELEKQKIASALGVDLEERKRRGIEEAKQKHPELFR